MKKSLVVSVILFSLAMGGFTLKWRFPLAMMDTMLCGYDRMLYGSTAALADLPGVNSVGTDPDDWIEIVIGSDELCNPYDALDSSRGVWRCIDAQGNLEWYRGTGTDESRSSPMVIDFTGDDNPDIVGGTTSGWNVEAMDRFGNFVWTFPANPIPAGPFAWHSSPGVGDFVPDPFAKKEIIIGCNAYGTAYWGIYCLQGDISDGINDGINFPGWSDYPVFGGIDGQDWDVLWYFPTVGPVISTPAVGDIDNDGTFEVVFGDGWSYGNGGGGGGYIYCLNAATGTLEWQYNTGSVDGIPASPALADFDGDGDLEIIVGAMSGNLYFIDGDENGNGAIDATEIRIFSHSGAIFSSPAIGDVDDDGQYEVVAAVGGGWVKCFSYTPATGYLMQWAVQLGDTIISSPALCGAPTDPQPWPFFRKDHFRSGFYPVRNYPLKIVVGSVNGNIYMLNGTDGSILGEYDVGMKVCTSPVVADIDRDCFLDVVITGFNTSLIDSVEGPDTIFCLGTDIQVYGCQTITSNITEVYAEGCSLLYVTVCVYDEDSNFYGGLNQSDFTFILNSSVVPDDQIQMLNDCPIETLLVDIILLLDFSTSMDDNIDTLWHHVPEFIHSLSLEPNVDWRVGILVFNGCPSEPDDVFEIVKTSFTGPNACQLNLSTGPDHWASDSTQFACLFNATMEMYSWPAGSRGSGYEDQFGAIYRANSWFDFRPGARKFFVLFTDERPIVNHAYCSPAWGEDVGGSVPYDTSGINEIISFCQENNIIVVPVTPHDGEFEYYILSESSNRRFYRGYYRVGPETGGAWFYLYTNDYSSFIQALAGLITQDSCCYQFAIPPEMCVDPLDIEVVVSTDYSFATDDTTYQGLCPPAFDIIKPYPCGGITSCAYQQILYLLTNPQFGAIDSFVISVSVNDSPVSVGAGSFVHGDTIGFVPTVPFQHGDVVVFSLWAMNIMGCQSVVPPCTFRVDLVPPSASNFSPTPDDTIQPTELLALVISADLFDDFSGLDTSQFSNVNISIVRNGTEPVSFAGYHFESDMQLVIDSPSILSDGQYTICILDLVDSPDYDYCPPNVTEQICWNFWLTSIRRTVSLGDTSGIPCDTVSIPVIVDSLCGADFQSLDFWFHFPRSIIQSIGVTTEGAILPANVSFSSINDSTGHIHIVWNPPVDTCIGGAVAYIRVAVSCNAKGGEYCVLYADSARFNNGYPSANWENGFFFVRWRVVPWTKDIYLYRDDSTWTKVTIGGAYSASEGWDDLDIVYLGPVPGGVDGYIELVDTLHPEYFELKRSIQDLTPENNWTINARNDSLLIVRWNYIGFPEGEFALNELVDMKRDTMFVWRKSDFDTIVISWRLPSLAKGEIELIRGWNLISFPRLPVCYAPAQVFPFALAVVGYNAQTGAFFMPSLFEKGAGYYVYSPCDTVIELAGAWVETYSRQVYQSWNLIGATAYPRTLSDIIVTPPGLILPFLYDYSSGMFITTTDLLPGKGYWIISIGNGFISVP